jgi:hypothetical protein
LPVGRKNIVSLLKGDIFGRLSHYVEMCVNG